MAGSQKKHELCARKVCSPGRTHFPSACAVPLARRKFQRMVSGLQSPLPLSSSSHIYPCWGIRRRESNYVIFQSAHTNLPYPWCRRAGAILHLSRLGDEQHLDTTETTNLGLKEAKQASLAGVGIHLIPFLPPVLATQTAGTKSRYAPS